jgi:HD-GYP domain-containing protein (c-di-GMP phosphodiesterase class II)
MRAMMLERVQPSMKLGKTLFANDGRVLLHRGTELSDAYLDHLRSLGYTALYVEDPQTADVEAKEFVSDKTRLMAVAAVRTAFTELKEMKGGKLQQDWTGRRSLYNAANSIVSEVSLSKDLCIQLMELRSADGYTFAHSVNVCILGMALARKLEVPFNKMVDLAIGLLVHDIGKLLLPEALRDDIARPLTPEEEKVYETHAEGGYGLLRDLGSTFGAPSKIVALQHHERWDGEGYPKGLKGTEIHEFAQICAIANTYDRLTTSAAYGRRAAPHEALEFIMGAGGTLFRLELVQAFLEVVAPYPLGTTVRLNTNETGVVVAIEKGMPQRPTLKMMGERYGEEMRLLDHQDRVIVGVVEA